MSLRQSERGDRDARLGREHGVEEVLAADAVAFRFKTGLADLRLKQFADLLVKGRLPGVAAAGEVLARQREARRRILECTCEFFHDFRWFFDLFDRSPRV